MGQHDRYGKAVLRAAAGSAYVAIGPTTAVDYGAGKGAIDGTVDGSIAVEIESRTGKQVRGAVLDLICHKFPRKLLVLIPMYMTSNIPEQCRNILGRFIERAQFRVVELEGTGDVPALEADIDRVRGALRQLGFAVPEA